MKLSIDEVADALHLQLVNDSVVESEDGSRRYYRL